MVLLLGYSDCLGDGVADVRARRERIQAVHPFVESLCTCIHRKTRIRYIITHETVHTDTQTHSRNILEKR